MCHMHFLRLITMQIPQRSSSYCNLAEPIFFYFTIEGAHLHWKPWVFFLFWVSYCIPKIQDYAKLTELKIMGWVKNFLINLIFISLSCWTAQVISYSAYRVRCTENKVLANFFLLDFVLKFMQNSIAACWIDIKLVIHGNAMNSLFFSHISRAAYTPVSPW